MKKILSMIIYLTAINASALEFTLAPPHGFSMPDFDAMERASEIFVETVETLRTSDKVQTLVTEIENQTNTACSPVEKEWAGLLWYRLPYKCEGAKDYKLVIKARVKKGNVLVKNYKLK